MEVKVDTENLNLNLRSGVVNGVFDKAYSSLSREGYNLISTAEEAKLRMQQRLPYTYHPILAFGDWVKEDFLYIPGEGRFLTKTSPINSNSKEATLAHKNGDEFYLNLPQLHSALQNSIKLPDETTSIPTDQLGEEEISTFIFGSSDNARKYGQFMKEFGIPSLQIQPLFTYHFSDQKVAPFARKCRFRRMSRGSSLEGYRLLTEDNRVRGIQEIN